MTVTEPTPATTESADGGLREVDAPAETVASPTAEVVDEVLVEEISIDGMCGVY